MRMKAKQMTWTMQWDNMSLYYKPSFVKTTVLLLNSTSREVSSIDQITAIEEIGSLQNISPKLETPRKSVSISIKISKLIYSTRMVPQIATERDQPSPKDVSPSNGNKKVKYQ
jgi:hypothetical protein